MDIEIKDVYLISCNVMLKYDHLIVLSITTLRFIVNNKLPAYIKHKHISIFIIMRQLFAFRLVNNIIVGVETS